MKETLFVIGVYLSEKSRHALKLAEKYGGKNMLFLATCPLGIVK